MSSQIRIPHMGEVWLTKFDYEIPDGKGGFVTKSVEDRHFVLTLNTPNMNDPYPSVFVAPILFETEYATHLNVFVGRDDKYKERYEVNPLGNCEFIIGFDNVLSMLVRNLDGYEGKFTNSRTIKGFKGMWKMAMGLDDENDDISGVKNANPKSLLVANIFFWKSRNLLRLTEDQKKYWEQVAEETEYLQEPVIASLGCPEYGDEE